MDASKWLTHASMLGGQGRGRPPIVDLRRGVSAAYYALYHELTRHAAEHALPQANTRERNALRRSYGHGSLKTVCSWVAGKSQPNGQEIRRVSALTKNAARLVLVSETFLDLQQRRHEADYDHDAAFSKTDVVNAVAQSRAACAALNAEVGGAAHQAFMALITLGARDLR